MQKFGTNSVIQLDEQHYKYPLCYVHNNWMFIHNQLHVLHRDYLHNDLKRSIIQL